MSESRWGLAGQAQGRANQVRQTQNEDARSRSTLDKLPSAQQALSNYGRERYGQDARKEFDKWAATKEGQARIRLAEENIRAGRAGGTQTGDRSSVRDRAIANQRSVFEETYIKERIRQDSQNQTNQGGKSNSPRGGNGSSKSAPTKQSSAQFANTSTPKQELEPISNKAVTFANSPSNVNVATPSRSFTISNFRSEIESGSVLPSHSYLVAFSPFRTSDSTVALNQMLASYRDPLTLRCENVVLPTIQLLEEENIRRYGYGPVEKIPYGVQFGDLTLTWIIDRYSEIPDFFHQWMNSVVNYEAKGALMREGVSSRPGLRDRGAYEVGFKDDYTCPVLTVSVFNQQLVGVADYMMYDVFPMNIQSANLSWGDENQYQKFTVTFAFTDMETKAPAKSYRELIDAFETGKINPYEEKKQITNKGRDAVRDNVQSEADPRITALASSPFAGITTPTLPTSPSKPIPPGPGAVKKDMLGNEL